MSEFNKPNYKNNNIVNLMSSISNNFNKVHDYNELTNLKSKDLKKYKNIILIVIDGLGYNFLEKHKMSFLHKNLKSKLSSTFPSTTACANTVYNVGYPPQQSALTGWDMNLKEIGSVITILPFVPYFGGSVLTNSNLDVSDFLDIKSFHKGFNCNCYSLLDKFIANSSFSNYTLSNTKVVPTDNYNDVFKKIEYLINTGNNNRQYIHAYFYELDDLSHRFGVKSDKVKEIFNIFDNKIKELRFKLKNTNTKIIVVADHGLIDTTRKSSLFLSDFTDLKACLTTSLSGEPRIRHCFVRPDKVKEFKHIIKTKLDQYCWCFKGTYLIKNNFFGLGVSHKKLYDRVGDYVLIFKENYVLYDDLPNSNPKKKLIKGMHGGVSVEEMFVPLITIDC